MTQSFANKESCVNVQYIANSTVQCSTVQYVPVSHEHVPGISLSLQCISNQSFSILKNIVKEKKKRLGKKGMKGRGAKWLMINAEKK